MSVSTSLASPRSAAPTAAFHLSHTQVWTADSRELEPHPDGPRLRAVRLVQQPGGEHQLTGLEVPRVRPAMRAAAEAGDLAQVRSLLEAHPEGELYAALLGDMVASAHPDMLKEARERGACATFALRERTEPDALTNSLREQALSMESDARTELLLRAAAAGDWALLQGLLSDQGVDPALRGEALKAATLAGRVAAVRGLLQGAELINPGLGKCLRPWRKAFPVARAVRSGSVETLKALVEAGANPRAYTKRVKVAAGPTLSMPMLSLAAHIGQSGMVGTLCDLGCAVDDGGAEQWTPLEVAARSERAEAAAELVLRGAHVDRGMGMRGDAVETLRSAQWKALSSPAILLPVTHRVSQQKLDEARISLAQALRAGDVTLSPTH